MLLYKLYCSVVQKFFRLILMLLFVFSSFAITKQSSAASLRILYAKPEATGLGDCSTWSDACTLQAALSDAVSGDQIWAMQGRHIPTTDGDRTISFQLKEGVAVYGGFNGTESSLDQRDWVNQVTILSGDLNGDDYGFFYNGENSYHVVKGATNAILDGMTVSGGNANNPLRPDFYGGGIFNAESSPQLSHLIITGNSSDDAGAGMANLNNSNPTITNVSFNNNIVSGNGAGIFNNLSSPTLKNVTFYNNIADYSGGGMFNYTSNPMLTNVSFVNNQSLGEYPSGGGGMANIDNSHPILENSTFFANFAKGGGAIYNHINTSVTVRSSILWNDKGGEIWNFEASTAISYSDIQGGYSGEGNIDADPILAQISDYGGDVKTMALLPGSPAIDGGIYCSSNDARGMPRTYASCDMGAFESQGFAFTQISGDNQSVPIYGYFKSPLCISATANDPLEPVNGGRIYFVPPSSGASVDLSSNPAIFLNGVGCVNARANPIPGGPYHVYAHIGKNFSIVFTLTNIDINIFFLSFIERI